MALQASKVEIGAWIEPLTALQATKVEIGAWIEPGTITPEPGGGGARRRQITVVN